ncbi:MAG: hypothetical protein CMH83_19600 [Nocardioides sp.]|nr:hypothetical protein [Nocardioides sp.]
MTRRAVAVVITSWWVRLLDRLLGPRCARCRARVFPSDQHLHDEQHRAVDATATHATLLDGTRLCPAETGFATPHYDHVTCTDCLSVGHVQRARRRAAA